MLFEIRYKSVTWLVYTRLCNAPLLSFKKARYLLFLLQVKGAHMAWGSTHIFQGCRMLFEMQVKGWFTLQGHIQNNPQGTEAQNSCWQQLGVLFPGDVHNIPCCCHHIHVNDLSPEQNLVWNTGQEYTATNNKNSKGHLWCTWSIEVYVSVRRVRQQITVINKIHQHKHTHTIIPLHTHMHWKDAYVHNIILTERKTCHSIYILKSAHNQFPAKVLYCVPVNQTCVQQGVSIDRQNQEVTLIFLWWEEL